MILRYGNMFDDIENVNLTLVTTCTVVKNNGALVMGAGAAKMMRDLFPGIDKEFGKILLDMFSYDYYGIIVTDRFKPNLLGTFQVKQHYKDQADLFLIKYSIIKLFDLVLGSPYKKINLNFPGIGLGGLNRHVIIPQLQLLPDNVQVWEYDR